MAPPDDDGGWGRDGTPPTNMLYVYRESGAKEQAFARQSGKAHEGRLFLHEICTGNRVSYAAHHVNAKLTDIENEDDIKGRIVHLIPHLSPAQKIHLAKGISPEALEVVRGLNPQTASAIEQQQEILNNGRIAHHEGQTVPR